MLAVLPMTQDGGCGIPNPKPGRAVIARAAGTVVAVRA